MPKSVLTVNLNFQVDASPGHHNQGGTCRVDLARGSDFDAQLRLRTRTRNGAGEGAHATAPVVEVHARRHQRKRSRDGISTRDSAYGCARLVRAMAPAGAYTQPHRWTHT